MIDGTAVVNAKYAVFDPQNADCPESFKSNGSTAEHLALVLNRYEANLLMPDSSIMSVEELAIKLNVVRQTVSKWENGLSVPDSSMLIILANELDTTVSELLGEPVAEPTTDDLKILSEKLEVINLQLAKRSITKVKTIRWILISLCAVIVVIFIALASTNSFYLNWNYNDPELAVAGTILHGFEFLFVRLAPIVFLTSVVGVVVTYKKR